MKLSTTCILTASRHQWHQLELNQLWWTATSVDLASVISFSPALISQRMAGTRRALESRCKQYPPPTPPLPEQTKTDDLWEVAVCTLVHQSTSMCASAASLQEINMYIIIRHQTPTYQFWWQFKNRLPAPQNCPRKHLQFCTCVSSQDWPSSMDGKTDDWNTCQTIMGNHHAP